LREGNAFQVNLTYRRRVRSDITPTDAFVSLRAANPAPYSGVIQHLGCALVSSSPERFLRVGSDRRIESRPIKGTTPRGCDEAQDGRLRELLLSHPKYQAENVMIVDLMRNDIGAVSETGSVTVPALMTVETYPHVHQLVSSVQGILRRNISTVEAIKALFPAGSMTGAPKQRAMEIIQRVESSPRSVYSGAFGWIRGTGEADLGVVIRSAATAGDGHWWLGTGGGVTVDSTLDEEYAESRWKVDALVAALRTGGGESTAEWPVWAGTADEGNT
jgi:para-aminobenzoate synthetase